MSGLLYIGCSPNAMLAGYHSFHLGNSLVSMKLLLNWGGDPNVKNPAGKTVLHIHQNNLTLMRMFVEHCGAIPLDMNPINQSGLAPIHVSAKHSLISTAEFLMQNGADPRTKTERGHSLLHSCQIWLLGMLPQNDKGGYRKGNRKIQCFPNYSKMGRDVQVPSSQMAKHKAGTLGRFLCRTVSGQEMHTMQYRNSTCKII